MIKNKKQKQIHLIQVLPYLPGFSGLFVSCDSHSIPHHCLAKISDHPCRVFFFFLFSKLFFQQCFPGPSYPEMNTFLFCSVGTSMAFVMDNGDWADIGEKHLFFVGMPLFVSKCIIVYMSNLIFLPFTSYLQSPLNFLSIPSILT